MLLPSHFYGNLPLFQALPSQGKSEGFDSCGWPSNLTQIGLKSSINQPCDLEIWWMISKNNKAHLYYIKLCVSFQIHWWIQTGVYSPEMLNSGKNWQFLSHVNLKFDGWPWKIIGHLFYIIKLCVAFQSHWHIETGVAVRKCSIRVKIGNFLSQVTLKIDAWHWKTIGHLFCTMLSFVHHFKSIGEVKLELQPGNAQVG